MILEVAKDLNIQRHAGQPKTSLTISPVSVTPEAIIKVASKRILPQSLTNTLVGMSLVMLGFALAYVVTEPQDYFRKSAKSLGATNENLHQTVLPINSQNTIQQITNATTEITVHKDPAIDFKRKKPIIIQHGSTIYEIALNTYGANAVLGMDLIKEFNPEIKDLNWVTAGQQLVLPDLTQETLARKQGDGSYRLIVASYINRTDADDLANRIRREGYRAIITSTTVSNDLLLHRLEIDGLKTLAAANQSLTIAIEKKWLTLNGNGRNTELAGRRVKNTIGRR